MPKTHLTQREATTAPAVVEADVPLPSPPPDDGVLVVVRPEVVEIADHVLGNLFQRLYHGVERVRRLDGGVAAELSTSVSELEEILQLILDYVAPFPPATSRIPAIEVVESMVKNLAPGSEAVLMALGATIDGVMVAVDPGRASRAFALLSQQLDFEHEREVCTRVSVSRANRGIVVHLRFPVGRVATRSSTVELRWAVAEKLIELHGGTLAKSHMDSGEVEWAISLPSIA